ncbi:MAG: pyruvate, phosphate dikinase [Deltaproteobacteria bacterium]|nr:pyruvate, phosphate dikinase [Deltaproteobacteria bacterium]
MTKKYLYTFGPGKSDGNSKMKDLLGGKGANLAEMANLGIPVPPGFTISTEVCAIYSENNQELPAWLNKDAKEGIGFIEKKMGAKFGDFKNPLLVSVRSGARVSMPGMMDTILNLGLNEETLKGLIERTGNERFAYDAYRRFIQMYSDVVLEIDRENFEHLIDSLKKSKAAKLDTDLTAEDWKNLCVKFKSLVENKLGRVFPDDPWEQLNGAIGAVFRSWNNKRAIEYRRINNIPSHWGTAVNVQAMVFGNMGDDCATGVAFTRDPSTGERRFFGEYLVNAQGEDVVAGIRTPQPINISGKKSESEKSLEEIMPKIYSELEKIYQKLEKHYRDMQDIEFTIQQGKLWMLQTRNGKRTANAAVRIATEMVKEGLISKDEALLRIEPPQLDQLLHPTFDPKAPKEAVARGLPASPGAAVGRIVFSADHALEWSEKGEKVVLVRIETSPDDIHGMNVAEGILTARGGMTSHAAVVARGMGKCCVAGCGEIQIDYSKKEFRARDKVTFREGDWLSLNGSTGEVIAGRIATVQPELTGEFGILMEWVDEIRRLKVRTNADTPRDAEVAKKFGAEGIGLCRTEHMFFEPDRIGVMREMIVADDVDARKKALKKLLPYQKGDFKGIFKVMNGLPVTVRLLDPPLHEFLPQKDSEINELAATIGITPEKLREKVSSLHEFNPMLGHRGCRLGVTYPEIYAMQTQAVMEAVCELKRDENINSLPEIEIPLVGHVNELKLLKAVCDKVAEEVISRTGVKVEYRIGTMIELVRAAVTADEIAHYADFFSFGTNDLTQTTFGLSRDDAGKFLKEYVEKHVLSGDPFVTIDQGGVGKIMQIAIEKGRMTKPDLEIGICGEHGGEAQSVIFCHQIGLNYVSCSPYRVPIARLAAAQAVLKEKGVSGSETR